jgi:hypothetical protein
MQKWINPFLKYIISKFKNIIHRVTLFKMDPIRLLILIAERSARGVPQRTGSSATNLTGAV